MPRLAILSSRPPSAPVRDFLRAWSAGDRAALDSVIPLVHAELKKLARRRLAGERPNHTIQPTALEMRVFAGLSVDESARLLGVSPETIGRDWRFARAWLQRELTR